MVNISQETFLKSAVEDNQITDTDSEDVSLACLEISHKILNVPQGVIGFEDIKEYKIELLAGGIIYSLESIPKPFTHFYIMNPYLIVPNYSLAMRDEEYDLIETPSFEDIIVFCILTLQERMEETTCNLLGPLVLNNKKGLMVQVINDSGDWGTKHLITSGEKVLYNYNNSEKVNCDTAEE